MEQHPVPQNVTSFQFRLIGDMTIKQFGYLAAGAILAYISYILPLPFFFTWPLTVLFAFLGIGFAFIPIEERPMDVWVLSFLKSIYTPTQFVWHRTQPKPESPLKPSIPQPSKTVPQQPVGKTGETQTSSSANTPIATTLQGLYTQTPVVPKKSLFDALFSWVDSLLPGSSTQHTPSLPPKPVLPVLPKPTVSIQQQPIIEEEQKKEKEQEKNTAELDALQAKVASLQTDLDAKAHAEERMVELQKEMDNMAKQKQEMEEQLRTIKREPFSPPPVSVPPIQPVAQTVAPPPSIQQKPPEKPQGPTVKIIPPEGATRAGLPRLTTFPNVVTGIIKDNQGGLLPSVLVTVRDKEGVPLRALKTNKVGQFAASTQLPNGVYFIEVEDPRGRYTFDRAQVTLNGTIVPAIEIVAKSKRDIDRESLARQIFGQTPNS